MAKKPSLKKKSPSAKKDLNAHKGFEQIPPSFFARFVKKGLETIKL